MQIALLLSPIDVAPRAHLLAVAAGLWRRGADVRLLEVPPSPREDDEALRAARGAACAVASAGRNGLDPVVERHLLSLRRDGQAIVRFETAPGAVGALAAARPDDPSLTLIAGYDLVAIASAAVADQDLFRALGARRLVSVGPALDPETFYPSRPRRADICDVLVIAPRAAEHDAIVRELVLEPARRLPGHRFVLAGKGWDAVATPPNVIKIAAAEPLERNALYAAARFYLPIGEPDLAPAGDDGAGTIFEAAGAGACVLGAMGSGIERYLEPAKEFLPVRGSDDVVRALSLVTRTRIREIGRQARARVLRAHTYDERAADLLAALEAALPAPRPAAVAAERSRR